MDIGLMRQRGHHGARQSHESILIWIDCDAEGTQAAAPAGWPGGRDGIMPLRCLAPNWRAAGRPRTSEGAAAWIVQGMRELQPDGPYWFATDARHAALAHAIGLQLTGQDQELAFLGLLGERPPAPAEGLPRARPLPGWLIDPAAGRIERLDLYAGGAIGRSSAVARRVGDTPLGPRALWRDALGLAASEVIPLAPELDYQPLIKLQSGCRDHVPLFCVPGAGNSVTGLRDWGAALGAHWPVYGLQPRGTDAVLLPHTTVEAAAAMYLRAIESVAGDGPVHLLGHSFGGWVAFEIAQRWQALGRHVLSLTLLDSEAPDAAGVLEKEHAHLDICDRLAGSLELAAGRPLGVFRYQLAPLTPAQRLATLHAAMTHHGLLPARTRPDLLDGPFQTFGAALRSGYRPTGIWDQAVGLIQADDPRQSAVRNAQDQQRDHDGWLLWAPRLRQWHGPGNHMSMLNPPHVRHCVDWWLAQNPGAAGSPFPASPGQAAKDMGVH